jgi:hypothetical protein
MIDDSDPPSRRAFLGAATAAVLASGTPERRAAGAAERDPARVVVIGTGGRGSDLIRALTTIEGVEVVGVCEDYAPHLAQGAKYAGPRAELFADHRRALDRLRPQAAVIAVPLYLHFPIARDALDAGCDVFCEKTMCYRIDQARQLARQVAGTDRVFQVVVSFIDYVRRRDPKALVDARAGLINTATVLIANETAESGAVEFASDLGAPAPG